VLPQQKLSRATEAGLFTPAPGSKEFYEVHVMTFHVKITQLEDVPGSD
jgi:hypothetical protein